MTAVNEKHKSNQAKIKKNIFLICMLTIPVVHFFIFWLYINIEGMLMPFQNKVGDWVGFTHFKWMFEGFKDADSPLKMREALRNTLLFFAEGTLLELPMSLVISYFFYKKLRFHKFYNVVLYLPCIISGVVMTTVFKNFIKVDGPLDAFVRLFGFKGRFPQFLYDSKYAMGTLLFYGWWTGFGVLIILFGGAFSRIPEEVLEAGKLDGVGMFKELTQIILPMIWPTFSTQIILSFTGIFAADGPILLFTKGEYGTMTIGFQQYQQYHIFQQLNRSAAIGMFYAILGFPITLITKWIVNKLDQGVEY